MTHEEILEQLTSVLEWMDNDNNLTEAEAHTRLGDVVVFLMQHPGGAARGVLERALVGAGAAAEEHRAGGAGGGGGHTPGVNEDPTGAGGGADHRAGNLHVRAG